MAEETAMFWFDMKLAFLCLGAFGIGFFSVYIILTHDDDADDMGLDEEDD